MATIIALTPAQVAEYKGLKDAVQTAAGPYRDAVNAVNAYIAALPGAAGKRIQRAELADDGVNLILQ